jgi:hypothetical protein
MSLETLRIVAAAVFCGAGIGCQPTDPGCDLCTASVTVSGVVMSAAGPVAGAVVDARSFLGACADSVVTGESFHSVLSSSTGVFSLRVQSLLGPRDHCVALRVRSPAGAIWRDTIVIIPTVRMSSDFPVPSAATVTRNVLLAAQ